LRCEAEVIVFPATTMSQGTTSVVPNRGTFEKGFSPCLHRLKPIWENKRLIGTSQLVP